MIISNKIMVDAAFFLFALTVSFNTASAQQVVPLKGTIDPSDMVTLESRPGVTVTFQVVKPSAPALAAVVLFAGGHGNLQLSQNDGYPLMKYGANNFVIRTHSELLYEDFIAVLIDAPSNRKSSDGMFGGFRNSEKHTKDISAVVSYLKNTYDLPVWLHGTSAGTESVANAASQNVSGVSGIVLSSSVTETTRKHVSILEQELDKATVPVLVLAHEGDGCRVTPPQDAERIAEAFSASPKVEVRMFAGGNKPKSKPCEARSQHGFFGLELDVIDAIVAFIRANSG